jgi:hypothetical protein
MQKIIKKEVTLQSDKNILRAEILCNSLGGMPVPLITITDNVTSYLPYAEQVILQSELGTTLRK